MHKVNLTLLIRQILQNVLTGINYFLSNTY